MHILRLVNSPFPSSKLKAMPPRRADTTQPTCASYHKPLFSSKRQTKKRTSYSSQFATIFHACQKSNRAVPTCPSKLLLHYKPGSIFLVRQCNVIRKHNATPLQLVKKHYLLCTHPTPSLSVRFTSSRRTGSQEPLRQPDGIRNDLEFLPSQTFQLEHFLTTSATLPSAASFFDSPLQKETMASQHLFFTSNNAMAVLNEQKMHQVPTQLGDIPLFLFMHREQHTRNNIIMHNERNLFNKPPPDYRVRLACSL